MLLVRPLVLAVCVSACAHTVTNEQRLDGMTDVVVDSTEEAKELRCRDTSPEVQLSRDASQRKAERLARYGSAISAAKATSARFDDAFKKDPDLLYGDAAGDMKRRQSFCIELVATLQKEQTRLDLEPEHVMAEAPKPVEKEKPAASPAPAPAKKAVAAKAEEPEKVTTASAADDAFGDDADQLRTQYKKAKTTKSSKSKKKKHHATLARR